MEFTRKQKNNIKWLSKQFNKYNYYNSIKEYVDVKGLNLKELYNFNCKYIKDTDIMISVNKRPIKGGRFKYTAIGYDFRDYLENNNIKCEEYNY